MWDLSEVLDILNRWLLDNLLLQQVSFNSPILNWQKVKIEVAFLWEIQHIVPFLLWQQYLISSLAPLIISRLTWPFQ